MVADRGNLLTGFAGGKLVSIALTNGGVRWETTVSLPRGATELERVTDVVGVPVVAEREVCAVAYQGKIGCFDGANGNVSWSRDLSSTAGLTVDARYVFVSDDKGAVHALDRAGGATIWKQDKLFLRRLTAPLVLGDVVAVGDVEGYVHFLSRETGAFVGRVATDGSPIRSSMLRLGQGLLVQTQEGNLVALSLR
jgi:outer membrane protein assembly factor BamB